MDTRVYITDPQDNEIEVDMDHRDSNRNMVGVYMEGPMTGHEIVLTREMEYDAKSIYQNKLLEMAVENGEGEL